MKPTPKCSLFNALSSGMPHEIVLSHLLVCMYVCYQLFSKTTGLNCMKFSGMICYHPRTNQLDFGGEQVKVKNYWTKLHEIFRDDLSSSKDQSVRFWEQSGQR